MSHEVNCSKLEERKISEPGQDVLNVRIRSYHVRSCQIGLFTFKRDFSLSKKFAVHKHRLACSGRFLGETFSTRFSISNLTVVSCLSTRSMTRYTKTDKHVTWRELV